MNSRRKLLLTCAALPAISAQSTGLLAQTDTWPERPIRLIVPFDAGSTPDIFARIVGRRLSETLQQSIVVENRPGAGGLNGTDLVAKSRPDGYTLGVSVNGPLVNSTVMYKRMPYDPFRDLTPIAMGVHQGNVLVVGSSVQAATLSDLVTLLKAQPGRHSYASIGVGSLSHLSVELFKTKTGTFIVHIPYRGSPAAVMSVLQGETAAASLATAAVMSHIASGKLRALGVTTAERLPQLPKVPTFRESGLDVVGTAWIGVIGPAALPQQVVSRLNTECNAAMRHTGVMGQLAAQYMTPSPGTPEQFATFMRTELAKWTPVIQRSGATTD
jgi:tripartite-type tricarboxylate transporter receptor subunit TctC